MFLMATYHLRCAKVIDVARNEKWFAIAWSMRCQTLQLIEQSLINLLEVELHIDVERLLGLLRQDVVTDILLETTTELRDVFLAQGESYGIGVTTEVLQQVATRLDSIVDVEACHRTGRA